MKRKILLPLLFIGYLWSSEEIVFTHPSFQGYTGLINTPNAQVLDEGSLSFTFNNQFDYHLSDYDYDIDTDTPKDFVFGIGLFQNLEIQGRLKDQPGYVRDLSPNIKFRLPLPSSNPWLPDIAVGAQDFAGEANHYENYYAVLDKSFTMPLGKWHPAVRGSVGYGYSRSNHERMDGLFGGVEISLAEWFSIMGDYDGEETFVGGLLHIPQSTLKIASIDLLLSSNLSNNGESSVLINLTFPLMSKRSDKAIDKSDTVLPSRHLESTESPSKVTPIHPNTPSSVSTKATIPTLDALADILTDQGLQNIDIGRNNDTIFIAYENIAYLHNELDALSVVLRETSRLSDTYRHIIIQIKKSAIPVFTFQSSLEAADNYFKNPSPGTKRALAHTIKEVPHTIRRQMEIVQKNTASLRFLPHLVISPELTTFLGTDLGVLDYQLLLAATGYLNLYDGVDLTVRAVAKVSESDNMNKESWFGYAYSDGGLSSAMAHYSYGFDMGVNTLSAGLYDYDYVGVTDQALFKNGNHTFGLKGGYYASTDDDKDDRTFLLLSYTYNYAPLDIYATVQGGQYWEQDTGFDVELKRFFGDIAVFFKYLQTSPEDDVPYSNDPDQYIGLGIELPLDFKKSKLRGKLGQINGDPSWSHMVKSTVNRDDGTNIIVPFESAHDPVMDIDVKNYFYDRNRLSIQYIKNHLDRL